MPDHARMLPAIPPKHGAAGIMGHLEGEGPLMIPGRHANLKHELGNRGLRSAGHCVPAVGMNEATAAKHVREQEAADIAPGKSGVKEHGDPFSRGPKRKRG